MFVRERGGAVVWPEVQSLLAETSWIHDVLDRSVPANWHIDPHHLRPALSALALPPFPGFMKARPPQLMDRTETLQGRAITAWVDSEALLVRGEKTRVLAVAGAKRRLNRRLNTWTSDVKLCGGVAEALVDSALRQLKGSCIWLHSDSGPGRVSSLLGRPIAVGGPLDAAGEWPKNPEHVGAGTVPFAVEVKNVRSILYPYDHDVWDLLAKVGAFPDVLPVLVARKIHWTTFRMFKDLGVLGYPMGHQYFSLSIDEDDFKRVTRGLGLTDAERIDPGRPPAGLVNFFARTGPANAATKLERWAAAAHIVEGYPEFREPDLHDHDRRNLWREFAKEVIDAGLYEAGQWAPHPFPEEEDEYGYDDF